MQQQNIQPITSIPHHTSIKFNQPKQPDIYFTSQFDSGNMSKVNRNSYDHYSIWTAVDAQGTSNEGYPKSWFYFQVGGFINRKITFSIHRVHFLWAVSKRTNSYRPVLKINYQNQSTQWQRLDHSIISLNLNDNQQLVLKFDFYFTKQIKSVRFAFLYPYSYEDQRNQVLRLKNLHQQGNDKQIFFKQYELIKSYQNRILDLLIISSHQGKDGFQNIKFDQYFDMGQKLVKFRNNKPIIFVSARVHPIQTPSSFCMKGIIDFLLDKNDYRSYLLRKYFVFALIPMLNPDGVSNGHCRMDHLNQNLNRYYKNPDPIKQSPCYAVRKLCEHYQKDNRMFMYLDLHAHPANKGNFMFGNAIYDFIEQVQSQVYPKILSQNCINFQFQNCIFSRRHMKAKDRNEDMNKQGCGRVVLYKDFGIPHAYTLECGYHMNSYNNQIQQQNNKQNRYIIRYKWGKNGQKIYQNIQRLFSLQLLSKIEQTINKQQKKEQQQSIQQNLYPLEIDNNTNKLQKTRNIQQNQDIKLTTKSIQNNQQYKSYLNRKQKWQIKRYSNKDGNINKSKNQIKKNSQNKNKNVHSNNSMYDGYDIFEYTNSIYDDNQNAYYKRQLPIYDVGSYQNLGRNMLITILDIFNKNPYSRSIDLNQYRKQIAQKQSKLDRFRKQQAGIRNKMKNIVELIEEQFYSPWYKRNVFNVSQNILNDRTRRNKTLQFHITKSSHNKMRKSTKQTMKQIVKQPQLIVQSTKRQLMLQSEVIKTSISIQNSQNTNNITSLNKISSQQKKAQQYENRNNLLAKKLKNFKSKHKGQLKQLSLKDSTKQQHTKKSIPLPTSQNNITLQQQIKVIKNQGLCLSTKIIKNPSYNMVNLRMKNFMMQGNNSFTPNYNAILENNYHNAHILTSQNKKLS